MTLESHRCCVDGCPNLAAYEVHRYLFDPLEGAVVQLLDESCPFICIEHAMDNELRAAGDRKPWDVVDYPHTNREHLPGVALYVQLDPAYAA